jgi:hypothetical protein
MAGWIIFTWTVDYTEETRSTLTHSELQIHPIIPLPSADTHTD